ncbi:MAG: hypothetical protein JXK50_01655 [Campylobacterales bacterium]|nr:hypothetical protein [Campylobacterales bacterium]
MKFWLTLTLGLLFFVGCSTTNTSQTYKPSTFNVSSSKRSVPTKSTTTYPGSEKQRLSDTVESSNAPLGVTVDNTDITSTTLAMATPTPSTSLERPLETEGTSVPLTSVTPPLNDDTSMIKIAVLVPQRTIKKYAITSVNSVIAYLLYKNYYFDLNVFNSGDEQESSIRKALAEIKEGGYHYIIAPVTQEGANIIALNETQTPVFIPTLHASSLAHFGENIIFGGIDYDQQIALLAQKANSRVGSFEDGSSLSYQLNGLVKKHTQNLFYEKRDENSKANFRQMFKGNSSLNNTSLFLNTPLVTSSLITSQLRANSLHPHVLLSTQINYKPLLLTLTQYEDRDQMFIANSIQRAPAGLEESNSLFGHEIVYDWVNYSTSIGIDYLCYDFFEGKAERLFKEPILKNQVIYNTSLYQPGRNEFIQVP